MLNYLKKLNPFKKKPKKPTHYRAHKMFEEAFNKLDLGLWVLSQSAWQIDDILKDPEIEQSAKDWIEKQAELLTHFAKKSQHGLFGLRDETKLMNEAITANHVNKRVRNGQANNEKA